MQRREFITLFSGAAATYPLAVRAQQPGGRVYRVGYFAIGSRERTLHLSTAFEEGLRSLGYRVGQNVVICRRLSSIVAVRRIRRNCLSRRRSRVRVPSLPLKKCLQTRHFSCSRNPTAGKRATVSLTRRHAPPRLCEGPDRAVAVEAAMLRSTVRIHSMTHSRGPGSPMCVRIRQRHRGHE